MNNISATPQFSVLIPVGPNEIDVDRIADIADALACYENDRLMRLVLVNDGPVSRDALLRTAAGPLADRTEIIRSVRNGKGHPTLGGLTAGFMGGMAHVASKPFGQFVVKIDTDAAVIGAFAERICQTFVDNPQAGVLGSCFKNPNGLARGGEQQQRVLGAISQWLAPHKDRFLSGRTKRWPTTVNQLKLRARVRHAMRQGFDLSENVSGGAYAVSAVAINKMKSARLLNDPLVWIDASVGEDWIISLYARYVGLKLHDYCGHGEVFGVTVKGLPCPHGECVGRGYGVIHSVKNDEHADEKTIRDFFKARRAEYRPAVKNVDKPLRILLLTSVLPWPLRRNGGSQRTSLVREALQRHGTVETLAIGGPMLVEPSPDLQRRLSAENIVGCFIRTEADVIAAAKAIKPFRLPGPLASIADVVAKYKANYTVHPPAFERFKELMSTQQYDLIVSRYLQPALQCGVIRLDGERQFQHVPLVLDFDDIDWLTLKAQIRARPWRGLTGPIAARQVLKNITDIGVRALGAFSSAWVTSDEDLRALPADFANASVLPNIPFSADPARWIEPLEQRDASSEILFVGDLQLPPNRDGLNRFIGQIWPGIHARVPGSVLTIVGRGLTDESKARWSAVAGTNVVGFAADLNECYARCAFTIAPLWFGGGTKIKVLETLAFGRTAVVTPHALRGYADIRDAAPACLAIADSDEAFIKACVDLLNDPAARRAMADRGRAVVAQNYSPERFRAIVDAALFPLLRRRMPIGKEPA